MRLCSCVVVAFCNGVISTYSALGFGWSSSLMFSFALSYLSYSSVASF
ncbi:unnamed protein product [Acidithrix sp. C25]|nr:unnamed protein product [Acidithrix sp. C25]